MEVWEIVGIEKNAKFKADDGTVVSGVRLHLSGDPEAGSDLTGKQVRNQFISNNALKKFDLVPAVGQTIIFHFNRYGNISNVEVL